MGYRNTAWARQVRGISSSAKTVLFILADQADNDTAKAWPSRANIAADAGISERQVTNLLGELQKTDLITEVTRGNSHHSTMYQLNRNIHDAVNRKPSSGTDGGSVRELEFPNTGAVQELGFPLTVRNSQKGQFSSEKLGDCSYAAEDGGGDLFTETLAMPSTSMELASDDRVEADIELIVNHPAYLPIDPDHKSQLRLHIKGGLQIEGALDALAAAEKMGQVINHYALGERSAAVSATYPRGGA